MLVIPLQAIAKQNLAVVLDTINYILDVLATAGVMSMNITRGTDVVVQGQRIVAGQPCIPFANLVGANGQFIFLTQNDELPNYSQFGVNQFLIYASAAEITALFENPVPVLATLMAGASMTGAALMQGVGA